MNGQTTSTPGGSGKGKARKRSKEDLQCAVCGDTAHGTNFGAVSCESCKAFFRRNAVKEKQTTCLFKGNCDIHMTTRRFCPHCRLEKCFKVGMLKHLILDEIQRKERMEKVRQNRVKRKKASDGTFRTDIDDDADSDFIHDVPTQANKEGEGSAYSPSVSKPATPLNIQEHAGYVTNLQDGLPSVKMEDGVGVELVLTPSQQPKPSQCAVQISTGMNNGTLQPVSSSSVPVVAPTLVTSQSNVVQHQIAGDIGALTVASQLLMQTAPLSQTISQPLPSVQGLHQVRLAVVTQSVTQPITSTHTATSVSTPQLQLSDISTLRTIPVQTQGGDASLEKQLMPNPADNLSLPADQQSALDAITSNLLGSLGQGNLASLFDTSPTAVSEAPAYRQMTAKESVTIHELEQVYNLSFTVDLEPLIHIKQLDPTLNQLVNQCSITVLRIIKFSKRLEEFARLPQDCQIGLLKGTWIHILLLRSVSVYDIHRDVWETQKGSIPSEILKNATGYTQLHDDHVNYCRSIRNIIHDDVTLLIILLVIVLFSPEGPHVTMRDTISDIQDKYLVLMKHYLEAKYTYNQAADMFPRLMFKIKELKTLAEVHGKHLLDVNPREIEPIMLEILDLK